MTSRTNKHNLTHSREWVSEKKASELHLARLSNGGYRAVLLPSITTGLVIRPLPQKPTTAAAAIASAAMVSTTLGGFGLSPQYRRHITRLHGTFQAILKLRTDETPTEKLTTVIRFSLGLFVVPTIAKILNEFVPVKLALMVLHYARLVSTISQALEYHQKPLSKDIFDAVITKFAGCFGVFIHMISQNLAEGLVSLPDRVVQQSWANYGSKEIPGKFPRDTKNIQSLTEKCREFEAQHEEFKTEFDTRYRDESSWWARRRSAYETLVHEIPAVDAGHLSRDLEKVLP